MTGAADRSESARSPVVALPASRSSLVAFRPAARRRSCNPPCREVAKPQKACRASLHIARIVQAHTRPPAHWSPFHPLPCPRHAIMLMTCPGLPPPARAMVSAWQQGTSRIHSHWRRPSIWDYSVSSSGKLAASSASSNVNLAIVASFSCSSGMSSCSVTSSGSAWNGGGASNRKGTFSVSCP